MSDMNKLRELSKNLSVLYVEDNDTLRTNAEKLLRKFFHIVSVAEDGEDGLDKFKRHEYPLVITDIKMPKMDGLALTKEIKKLSPNTHVIVMSAFDDKEYLLELIEYGIFRFLKKPVSLKALTDALYIAVLDLKPDFTKKPVAQIETEDEKSKEDEKLEDLALLFNSLEKIKDKSKKLEVHNYYKGLSITNDAKIIQVKQNSILIQTTSMQEKAIEYEKKASLASEHLPYTVKSDEVNVLSSEKQLIELSHLKFTKTSPIQRSTIRVQPEGKYTISLYMNEMRIAGAISIKDISLNSIRLSLEYLPAGLRNCQDISVELSLEKDTVSFSVGVDLLRIDETPKHFDIVFNFQQFQKGALMKYITRRQMAMIREFKGMEYE